MIKRALAGLLVALLAAPLAVFAQATKAGVVTVVEGNVIKRRVALPDSPLKFKDDVFMQDTVTTGDQSLARLLLGGKAVVTVRERSVLTITEVPGRSTIDLQSGKFALAVAREKMGANEEIQIRTPNAVAGVRGTVVVTEVERQGAQVGTGVPAVVTNFFVLRGAISAQPRDAAGNPVGNLLQIGTLQSYSGAGFASPRVLPVLSANLPGILAGLQPTGRKGGGDAGKEQVKAQQQQQAVLLASAVAPSGGQNVTTYTTFTPGVFAPPYNVFSPSQGSCLGTSGTSSCTGEIFPVNFAGFDGDFTSTSTDPLFAILNSFLRTSSSFIRISQFGNGSLAGPLAHFTNSTILTSGSLLDIQGGKLKSTGTSALLGLDPTFIASAQSLIVLNGGSLTLAGPLLTDTNGTILTGGSVLDMKNGATLTDTSTSALVQLNGTAAAAVSALTMSNATMKLAGPLAIATNVTGPDPVLAAVTLALVGVNLASFVDGPFIAIENKSSLTSTGTSPLIQITSAKIDNDENIIRVATGSSITLAGSLLKTTDTRLIAGNVNRSLISITDGSSITTAGTTDPLLQFTGTASGLSLVTAARTFLNLSFNTTSLSPALTLSGPLLSATLTNFSTGDPTVNTFSFLFIGDGTQVKSTSTQAFMSFTNSTVDTSGNIVDVRRSTASTPSRLTLAGPLLTATNSTFNHTSLGFGQSFGTAASACCTGFFIGQGGQLSSTTSSALIQLTNSTVTGNDAQSGGNFFKVTDSFGGAPTSELVASSSVSLAGPLLQATNSTITSLFDLVAVQRSSFSSTTSSPLISLSGGSVTVGGTNPIGGSTAFGRIFGVFSSDSSGVPALAASVVLAGPLLTMTNGATVTSNTGVLSVFNGGTFTSTTTSPLISLNASTLTLTRPTTTFGTILAAADGTGGPSGTSPATITLSGPLLSMANGSLLNNQDRLVDSRNGAQIIESHPTDPFIAISGGTHTVGGQMFVLLGRSTNTALDADPLITALGSITVGTDQPLRRSGSGAFVSLSNGATLTSQAQGLFLDTALLSATAPLLDATGGSTLTSAADAILLNQKAKLTAIGPVFRINASTVNITGSAFNVGFGSGLAITGDLVSISNGGRLNITNGGALLVNGGSIVNVTGALVNFSGTSGNQLNITNNLCTSCVAFGDFSIPVELRNGAIAGNVSIPSSTNTIKGSGVGTVTLSNPVTSPGGTAVIILDGATSKVRIGGI